MRYMLDDLSYGEELASLLGRRRLGFSCNGWHGAALKSGERDTVGFPCQASLRLQGWTDGYLADDAIDVPYRGDVLASRR